MVNIKDIKKKLGKIEDKKKKVGFLEKELEKSKAKKLKEEIKKLLLEIKDDLEERIVAEEETSIPTRFSRQDLEEAPEEITEEITEPAIAAISPEAVSLLQGSSESERYEESIRYTGNYKLEGANYTLSSGQISYESITSHPFTDISVPSSLTNQNQDRNMREQTDPFYQRFVEEGIFTQDSGISHDQRQTIREKIGALTPNPEEAMRKEQELILEGKRIDKKYIKRFM